jgi:hypothetical protein
MNVDRRLERLCDCVTLVHGLGDRSRARLCIMSLVASLAGEAHSDRPASASPLIRSFAMPLNDVMPHGVRQRLKPFAPRILGTNDCCDKSRAEVLRRALAEEILPRIRGDFGVAQAAGWGGSSAEYLCIVVRRDLEARVAEVLEVLEGRAPLPGSEARIGSIAGELLALCARATSVRVRQAWYWDEAIGLLDRLCDVAAERRAPALQDGHVQGAEERRHRDEELPAMRTDIPRDALSPPGSLAASRPMRWPVQS